MSKLQSNFLARPKRLIRFVARTMSAKRIQSLGGHFTLLFLAISLASLAFHRLLDPGYQFVGNDSDLTYYWIPVSKFFRLWIHSGVLPQGNPFLGLDHWFLRADELPTSTLNLIQAWLPVAPKTLDYLLFFHTLVFATSSVALIYRLGHSPLASLLTGLALGCTGTPLAQLFAGHISLYCTLCWSSLSLLFYLNSWKNWNWTILHSLLLGWMLGYGSFQAAYLILLQHICLALLYCRSEQNPTGQNASWVKSSLVLLLRLILAFQLAACLAWPIWYSALENGTLLAADSLLPANAQWTCWISLFIPHFLLGEGQNYSWTAFPGWEGAPGIGGSVVFLTLVALLSKPENPKRPLAALALATYFAFLWVFPESPLFKLHSLIDPAASFFEVPSRGLFLTNFALGLLLAWSLDELAKQDWNPSARATNYLIQGGIWLSAFWVITYYADGSAPIWRKFVEFAQSGPLGKASPVNPGDYYVLQWTRFSAQVLLILSFLYSLVRLPQKYRSSAVAVLVAIDLLSYPKHYMNLRTSLDFELPPYAEQILKDGKIEGRMLNRFDPLWDGLVSLHRKPELNAPYHKEPTELAFLRSQFEKADIKTGDLTIQKPNLLLRTIGAEGYFLTWEEANKVKELPEFSNFTMLAIEERGVALFRDPVTRPLAYLSRNVLPVSGLKKSFQALCNPDVFSSNTVLVWPRVYKQLEQAFALRNWNRAHPMDPSFQETCRVVKQTPNEIHIECRLQAPSILGINWSYHPNWEVQVNGASESIYPVQMGLNMGVLLNPGLQQIVLYRKTNSEPMKRSTFTLYCLLLFLTANTLWCLSRPASNGESHD
jgi:hypothetical protein